MSPRIQRKDSPLNLYHVLVNGNNNEDIFIDDDDKRMFIEILFSKSNAQSFDLYAYCVLNNRANFLIKPKQESLSELMRKINMIYANYFNKKYERCGHVFHDRFKSKAIEEESILLPIIGYIHFNPVLDGLCSQPQDYAFSSAQYYDSRQNEAIVKSMIDACMPKGQRPAQYFESTMCSNEKNFYYDHCYANMNEIANLIVRDFLKKRSLSLEKIRQKDYCEDREYLIQLLRKNTGFSIRKISELIGINRGEVHRILTRRENIE